MPHKTPTGPTHRQQQRDAAQELEIAVCNHFGNWRQPRPKARVMPPMGQEDEAVPTSDHEEPRYPNYSHAESMFGARKLG